MRSAAPTNLIGIGSAALRLAALLVCLFVSLLVLPKSLAAQADPSAATAAAPVPAAVPAYRQANQIAIITVRGDIDQVTLMSLERRIKKATEEGADAIVLEIDTYGGEMAATLDICSLLKDRSATPANVVAWVRPKAISAGAIISLACREIVMAPGASIGDAAPIDLFGRQMAPTERAKLLSPLTYEIIDSARRNHYDEKLVQAFIMLGQELWMIENVNTGERIFVDRAEYKTAFGEDPPQSGPPSTPPPLRSPVPIVPFVNKQIPRASEHSGLDPEALRRQIEFEQMLPPARQTLTEADRGQWRVLLQVTDGSSLLTPKADEALYYGLAREIIATDAELQSYFGAQTIVRYDQTWSEGLVRFLMSWPVKAILIIIFLVCLFVELSAPGFGVFGATAIVAALFLVGAPALAGMAQWWDILLIVLGFLLVATELFILPGFGVVGLAGAVCLLVGVVGTFVSGDLRTVEGQSQMWTGLMVTLLSVFGAGIIIWFLSRWVHSMPLLNRIILTTELGERDAAGPGLLAAMGAAQRALSPGDTGVAETDLRPAGRANFEGRLVDVKSVGTYIDKGTPVRVVSVGRFVIEVEEAGA